MEEQIYQELLKELVFEECIDINYALRTGQLSVHEPLPYNLEEYLERAKEIKKVAPPPQITGNEFTFAVIFTIIQIL